MRSLFRWGKEGELGWVWSRPHPEARAQGLCPYLRIATGPGDSQLSGLKAYQPVDHPGTPRWHTREGDAAAPVCVG